jgi:hypothetical protein
MQPKNMRPTVLGVAKAVSARVQFVAVRRGLLRFGSVRLPGPSGQIPAPFSRLIIQATRPTAIANTP